MSKETIEKLLNATLDAGMQAKTDDFSKAIEAMEKKLKAVQKKELAQGSINERTQDNAANGNMASKTENKSALKKGKKSAKVLEVEAEIASNKAKPDKMANKLNNKKELLEPNTTSITNKKDLSKQTIVSKESGKKNVKSDLNVDTSEKKVKVNKEAENQNTKKVKKPKNDSSDSTCSKKLTIPEMVINAVKALNEKKGSDAKTVKAYITETYKAILNEKDLPTTFQVNKALLKAVEEKVIIQNKKRFQLSSQGLAVKTTLTAKSEKKEKIKSSNLAAEDTQLKRKNVENEIENDNKKPPKKKGKLLADDAGVTEKSSFSKLSETDKGLKQGTKKLKGGIEEAAASEMKSKKSKKNAIETIPISIEEDKISTDSKKSKGKKLKKTADTITPGDASDESVNEDVNEIQPELPSGWRRHIVLRKGGATGGKQSDVYMYDPEGKKFRSKTQLSKYFEENPDKQISEDDLNCIFKAFRRDPGEDGKIRKSVKSNSDHNSQPKKPKKQIPLSPKAEMLVNAIKSLASKKGSDKKAIRNYIAENNKDNASLKFVHKELKKCVEKGILIANRRFFKIPTDEVDSSKKKSKKKRAADNVLEKDTTEIDSIMPLNDKSNAVLAKKKMPKPSQDVTPPDSEEVEATKAKKKIVKSVTENPIEGAKEGKKIKVKKMKKKSKSGKEEVILSNLEDEGEETELPIE